MPQLIADALTAQLRRDAPVALSLQLGEALRRLIADGALKPGDRLPPSRRLAVELALGRNTVIETYERLAAEGYLRTRQGAGCFVATAPPRYEMDGAPPASAADAGGATATALSSRARAVLAEATIVDDGPFAPCTPDLSLLRFDIWQRLLGRAGREARLADTQYASPGGHPRLREAIAEHLLLTRQVRCTAAQVVVVDGAQHGLDLCARLLAEPGERVWVEDPGYPGARRAFAAAGLHLAPVGLDAEGMAPTAAQWRDEPPRLIYLTPSHQFPTGIEMSVARRRALLAGATAGTLVLEDDYDGEFRLSGAPVPSLQGMAPERVVYLGTFSKVLFPALRLGYVVLPPALAEPFARAAARLTLRGRLIEQAALAEFMAQGHFAAHIRRMRVVYAERRALLEQVWRAELGDAVPLVGTTTGMHMSAPLPAGVASAVVAEAAAAGIAVQSLQDLTLDRATAVGGLVLGYGSAHDEQLRTQGRALARIVAGAMRRP